MNTRFYKLRHKPTGLFFVPAARCWKKANLSERGKAYVRKPSVKQIGPTYYTGKKALKKSHQYGTIYEAAEELPIDPSEWEICVYETHLVETLPCK